MNNNNLSKGGCAFPCEGGTVSGLYPDPGMTLRDYFAGQALSGLTRYTVEDVTVTRLKDIVAESYLYADAMLEARK